LHCGNLPTSVEHPKWTCFSCKEVLKVLPPTYKNLYHPVANNSTKVNEKRKRVLLNTTFKITDGAISADADRLKITAEYPEGPVVPSAIFAAEEPDESDQAAEDKECTSEPVSLVDDFEEAGNKDEVAKAVKSRNRKASECKNSPMGHSTKKRKLNSDPKQRSILAFLKAMSPKKNKGLEDKLIMSPKKKNLESKGGEK
jgi:hypothetical protein